MCYNGSGRGIDSLEGVLRVKVLMINGSARPNGCTFTALMEVASALEAEGISCEIAQSGSKPIRDCIGCGKCAELDDRCAFDDDGINALIQRAKGADGFVFGTPVYYAHPSGRVLSLLDRMFYACKSGPFRHKPAAAVASARRAGTTASIDVINKYFTIAQMPVVSSTYWNMVHGNTPEEVLKDQEGLQTMRNLGRNMAWLLRCIEAGREKGVLPPLAEKVYRTNFIR